MILDFLNKFHGIDSIGENTRVLEMIWRSIIVFGYMKDFYSILENLNNIRLNLLWIFVSIFSFCANWTGIKISLLYTTVNTA